MDTTTKNSTPRHTPGPFEIHQDRDGVDDLFLIVSAPSGRHIASIVYWDDAEDRAAQALADASLLAAAPRLLAALKELVARLSEMPRGLSAEMYAAEQEAITAIAEAEGHNQSHTRRP